jgi:glycosidase
VKDSIIYEVFPERFSNGDPINDPGNACSWTGLPSRGNFYGGDLQGIIDRLDYLDDLGVTCLYLTPVFAAPSNHKYDTVDHFRVDPAFGTDAVLADLARRLHARGMRLILDAVFAHVGDGHPAFQDVLARGEASPYRRWFKIDGFPVRRRPRPNYRACGGLASMPKLNAEDPEVQDFLCRVGVHWLRTADIDGWRLDMPWEIPHSFWRSFRAAVKSLKPEAFLFGELWGDAAPWLRGDQFDSAMNYRWRDIVLRFLVTQCVDARTFVRELYSLRRAYGAASETMVNLLGSHDTPRLLTVCRGQVGKAVQALALLLTDVGVPMLYYGDEIGLTGGNDPGCRGAMPWSRDKWNMHIYESCRALMRARHQHPALRRGDFRLLIVSGRVLVFVRRWQEDAVLVALNAGFQQERLEVRLPDMMCFRPLETWHSPVPGHECRIDSSRARLVLPPSGTCLVLTA